MRCRGVFDQNPRLRFLLDTNVLSVMRRRDRMHAKVAAWAKSVLASDLFLSPITILEIEAGTLLLLRPDSASGGIFRA